MRFSLLFSFAILQSGAVHAFTDSTTVSGSHDGINCIAYLHVPDDVQKTPLPLILAEAGSGIYSLSQIKDSPSAVEYVFSKKKAAVLTFDKPGIHPGTNAEDPIVEDRIYNQHTPRDLIECAKNALIWAQGHHSTVKNETYFFGHSEGSMVLARLYSEILSSNQSMAEGVQALLLSGTPMLGWRDIINSQLTSTEDRQKFWDAFARENDQDLRKFGELPYAYWKEILSTDPLNATFKGLTEKNPGASLDFFHGLNDKNTNVTPLLDLETWNRARSENNQKALHLSARYYNADHQLNLAALNDMIFMLMAYLTAS